MARNRFQVTGVPRRKHVRHREYCMKYIPGKQVLLGGNNA
jgi:hypothetical protein